MSEAIKEYLESNDHSMLGKCHSDETKERMSKSQKARWMNMTDEEMQTFSEMRSKATKAQWANMSDESWRKFRSGQKYKDTSIELAIRAALDSWGVAYIPSYRIGGYEADIFIPCANLVIECDGDYWHNLPGRKESDAERDVFMRALGYEVVRIWERDINEDAKEALVKRLGA